MNPFKVDYKDLEAVKTFAKRMGSGMLVVKHKDRSNYNITHADRVDLWDIEGVEVLFKT